MPNASSDVTKDILSGVIAAGNPCRVIRRITEEDKHDWEQKEKEYYEIAAQFEADDMRTGF